MWTTSLVISDVFGERYKVGLPDCDIKVCDHKDWDLFGELLLLTHMFWTPSIIDDSTVLEQVVIQIYNHLFPCFW